MRETPNSNESLSGRYQMNSQNLPARLRDAARIGLCSLAVAQMSLRRRPRQRRRRRQRCDPNADQTCHRHHRRESQLRPCLRHVPAEKGRDDQQSPVRGHREAERRRQGGSRTELGKGSSARRDGQGQRRSLPAEPAERGISQRPAARAAGRRPEGLLHSEPVRRGDTDCQLPGEPHSRRAIRVRTADGLLHRSTDRRHRSDQGDAR